MKRPIRDGFFLVWRHQRLVWWVFFVNLVLGFLASLAPGAVLHFVVDKSLYTEEMSKHFDATVFVELLAKPEVSTLPWMAGSLAAGLIFLFYMLFISGGVLAVYHQDRKLTRGQFFESCGDFFWRMVRLLLWSIIPFAIVFGLLAAVQRVSGKMASDAPRELQGFFVQAGGSFLCLLFALFVRAWFDLAQARTVIDDVRGIRVLSFRSFVLALRNLLRLLSIYLTITFVAGIAVLAAWTLWLRIPHTSFGASWLLLEPLTLVLVGVRLWQRAATVVWYENYAELHTPPLLLLAANSSSATHDGTCGGRSITGGLALVRRRWGPGHSKKAIALTVSKLSALHAVALESSAQNRADTDHCGQVFRPVP